MAKPPLDGSPPPAAGRPRRTRRGQAPHGTGDSAPQNAPDKPTTAVEASSNKINAILPVETTATATQPTAQTEPHPNVAPHPATSRTAATPEITTDLRAFGPGATKSTATNSPSSTKPVASEAQPAAPILEPAPPAPVAPILAAPPSQSPAATSRPPAPEAAPTSPASVRPAIVKPGIPKSAAPERPAAAPATTPAAAKPQPQLPVVLPPTSLPPTRLARTAPALPATVSPPATSADAHPGTVDLDALTKNFARLVEEGGRAVAAYLKPREDGAKKVGYSDEINDAVKTLGQVFEYWFADPQRTVEMQTRLGKGWLDLWASAAHRLAGEPTAPVATPDPRDKRFNDPEWSSNQYFDFLKQAYLVTSDWAKHLVDDANELDPKTRQKAEFYMRQLVNAASPSNFIFTNPVLLRATLNENAGNLVRGTHMLAEDIEAGGGELKIRQSDASKFEVGRNLAVTPGKVIHQNELMQLIQYAPTTAKVLRRPVLFVPPWINKFYVLDLAPEKSLIKWCVDQGLTVFCISWVNPDEHLAQKDFADYMREGPLEALDVVGEDHRRDRGQCGRLLRRRHPARDDARLHGGQERPPHRVGHHAHHPGRLHLCGRPQGIRDHGGADPVGGAGDGRAWLSRRREDGDRLQPAALQRPDLALRGQQLHQGRSAVPVRPVVLEFGRDPHAGGQPLLLPAQLLPREQPHQGENDHRRRPASTSARSRRRSTISPPARTTSRRRDRSISARPSSAGRCGTCCRAPATSPAWSTRRAR